MKHIAAISFALLFSWALCAQAPKSGYPPQHKEVYTNVEKFVSYLSNSQKKRIEAITEDTKKEVVRLRSELESVRGQIGKLHEKSGDNSAQLFPLYDHESQLIAQISKEMYKCRVQIEEVLTQEQIKEFRESLKAERQKYFKRNRDGNRAKGDSKKTGTKKD